MVWLVKSLHLLGLLVAADTTSRSFLKPGALVAQVGRVLVVEDVVTLRYEIGDFLRLSGDSSILQSRLDRLHAMFDVLLVNQTMPRDLRLTVTLQRARVARVNCKLRKILLVLPEDNTQVAKRAYSRRTKRGLFNFVALLSRELFVTAQASDVGKLGKRLSVLERAARKVDRVLKYDSKAMKDVKNYLNSVIYKMNNLTTVVNFLVSDSNSLDKVMYLSEFLQATEDDVSDFVLGVKRVQANIVDAALSRVTGDLVPLDHLRTAIDIEKHQFSLIPLFDTIDSEFYYPLMEAVLTQTSILVHIPFKSSHMFNAWKIVPFPFLIDDFLLTITNIAEWMLVSDDLQLIYVTDNKALDLCRYSYLHLYVCPAYVFSFQSPEYHACELTLTQTAVNDTGAMKHCTYAPAPKLPVFHEHLLDVQFFYFRTATQVSLICQDSINIFNAQGIYP